LEQNLDVVAEPEVGDIAGICQSRAAGAMFTSRPPGISEIAGETLSAWGYAWD
jgi:hypothetical protein